MNDLKQQICDALATWIRQRPGLEFGNYGELSAYRAEQRSIARDKKDAETLLAAVRWRDSITAEKLIDAAKHSFSGRLEIVPAGSDSTYGYPKVTDTLRIEYCTGQYWPTEYRKAAAAVLAGALWDYMRDNMPEANGKVTRTSGVGPFKHETEHDNIDGMSPGDWLRKHFRKEFGSRLQRRWFN